MLPAAHLYSTTRKRDTTWMHARSVEKKQRLTCPIVLDNWQGNKMVGASLTQALRTWPDFRIPVVFLFDCSAILHYPTSYPLDHGKLRRGHFTASFISITSGLSS